MRVIVEACLVEGTGLRPCVKLSECWDRRLAETRAKLNLFRFVEKDLFDSSLRRRELVLAAERLRKVRAAYPAWDQLAPPGGLELAGAETDLVNPTLAAALHAGNHYLMSPRRAGMHIGLWQNTGGQERFLLALLTFAPFDLIHIADKLPFGLRPDEVMVLARQVTFSWSPPNTLSFTFRRACWWLLKHAPEVQMLVTYLDPNPGFTGAVYRAANWVPFGRERKARYLYWDGDYVTDREMIREFGTADFDRLAELAPGRVSRSLRPLRPLELFAYFLDPRNRVAAGDGFGYEFIPPSHLTGVG